jgi:predicted  nucleic acid-binding Zn-ribbon protein
MTLIRHSLFACAIFGVFTTPAALAQSTIFKCTDEKGITHYGETMPAACAKKDITELNRQASQTVRKLDAPLTPEQLKARAVESQKKAAEDQKVSDQRQKDMALLGTYGSERELDVLRDKDLAQIEQRRKFLESRIDEADAKVTKATNQMEFYIAGKSKNAKPTIGKDGKPTTREVPPQIQADFDRAKSDRKNLDIEINQLDLDKKETTAKFEAEKDRLRRLKNGMRPGTVLDSKGNVLIEAPIPRRVAAPTGR